MGEVLMHRKRI